MTKLLNKKLDKIMENQQHIMDFLYIIIYNQSPDRKIDYVVKPDTLKLLDFKYNLR